MLLGIFQNIGITEMLIVLAIILLLFGASRIPALARSLGKSVKEFKKGTREGEGEVQESKDNSQTKQETTK